MLRYAIISSARISAVPRVANVSFMAKNKKSGKKKKRDIKNGRNE